MRFLTCCILCFSFFSSSVSAQNTAAKGQLQGPEKEAIAFANIALFSAADSSLQKAGVTSESGIFELRGLKSGSYYLKATYLGMADLYKPGILLSENETLDLGVVTMSARTLEMAEAVITATRPMVEVRPDRTVFNVQGTINSAGTDALSLMRKAPGVTVDNNDNINVLGRAGVLIYLDGKRLPLSAQDLAAYLQSLPADQIDRIDIITNPGSRYEAEGNAGIIDIRLKKDKSLGANGSLNSTVSQGRFGRGNLSGTGNYRNKLINVFGSALADAGRSYHNMNSLNYQNGIVQEEINDSENDTRNYNFRLGTDFFLSKYHTVGFITSAANNYADRSSFNRITLARQSTPNVIDSILVAGSTADNPRTQRTVNLNYRYDNTKGRVLNFDLDYGNYINETRRLQPNLYYDATETYVLTEVSQKYDTPTDIDIYTAQLDFEDKLWGGNLGLGGKLSKVGSDNTFLVFDERSGNFVQNDTLSNEFTYDEMVWA
ncbi:MAG: outer membrane beta-barrel protein, partial [Bacteroidota bacterium]